MEGETNITESAEGVKMFRDPATGVSRPLVKPVREWVAELEQRLEDLTARVAELEAARKV